MTRRFPAAALILLVFVSLAAAQQNGNLRVEVVFADGRRCNIAVHVQLMSSAGTSIAAESYTNDSGTTELYNLEPGTYHLVISGQGIETADSGVFEVDSRKLTQSINVTVRRLQEADDTTKNVPGSSTVAAADMNIPESAAREFNKAIDLMKRQEWQKAIERLNRAVGIYPQYAAAWNNLGAAYARLGDRSHEQEALEKAVSLNDHLAPAFVSLAKLAIADRNMGRAENLLDKANSADPANAQMLTLLANVELLQQHYDQAIAACRKVHSLPGGSHAVVHYIAAHALEHENHFSDAVTEFQTFLKEEPTGERAEAVRKQLSSLQAQLR
jgi:tetratricopeptide (TPR) repeat protein